MRTPRIALLTVLVNAAATALGVAGCAATNSGGPRETLDAYSEALQDSRTEEAYALLSADARKTIPFEAFARMVRENPAEMREIVAALQRPSGPPLVTATVTAPTGETLLLVYEDGDWRIDASAIDLYGQSSPESAVRSFVRAFGNKRYDVLMKFVPQSKLEGLDANKLKAAWEGEQRDDMVRLVQALEAALPTARVEHLGERATMAYGAGGTVELVREQGAWKIEEFR
jgi:hypothetical protein